MQDVSDAVRRTHQKIHEVHAKSVQERTENKKILQQVKDTHKQLEASRQRMAEGILENVNKETKEAMDRTNKAREAKFELEEQARATRNRISEIDRQAEAVIQSEKDKLMQEKADLMEKQKQTLKEINEMSKELERNSEELMRQVSKAEDQQTRNNFIASENIHSRAEGVLDTIRNNLNYDKYCRYRLSAAHAQLLKLFPEDRTISYAELETLSDILDELEAYVDEAVDEAKKSIASECYIQLIISNLMNAEDPQWVSIDENHDATYGRVIIEFQDCVSTISITPDGEGGVKTIIDNDVDDGGDRAYHDMVCKKVSAIIADAAGFVVDDSRIDNDGIEPERHRSSQEVMAETARELQQRLDAAGM